MFVSLFSAVLWGESGLFAVGRDMLLPEAARPLSDLRALPDFFEVASGRDVTRFDSFATLKAGCQRLRSRARAIAGFGIPCPEHRGGAGPSPTKVHPVTVGRGGRPVL